MIYARKAIYQVHTYPWKQSGMPDRSPWFEYKSTPLCSAHVYGMLVLCYHDSDLIVGVYSAFCEWVCLIRHFVM